WARPPLQVRDRLLRLITELGAPSRAIYTKRGARLHSSSVGMWHRVQADNAITYRINLDNPLLQSFLSRLSPDLRDGFRRAIEAIAAGLPVDAIFADLAGSPEQVKADPIECDALHDLIDVTRRHLAAAGVVESVIPDILRVVEPFRSRWDD